MPRTTSGLTYRPALDGLRGLAVAAVLVFHLWPSALPGGWLGVDLFFVLSGYLITTLLVREYAATGHIDLVTFWKRRLRRLMPPLVLVLAFVVLAAMAWTLPSRRIATSLDVLSALTYVANLRFLFGNEAYFGSLTAPSPVRHTWSLAIEEQYYLFFPLLLMTLAAVFHKRRQLAWAIGGLALLSAWWMAYLYVPGVDPTRVYYGTDTRAFELLVGAVAGAWVGPSQWGRATPSSWLAIVEKLAFPALAAIVAALFVFSENSGLLFRGGLLALCIVAIAPILAAGSPHPNAFQRVLSFEPLRLLGLISYSLYLWHWPIHVFLNAQRLAVPAWLAGGIQLALSLAAAIASYRFVESPIRRRGVAALTPSRPTLGSVLAAVVVAAVVLGTVLLPKYGAGAGADEAAAGGGELTVKQADYVSGTSMRHVTLLGNSIPFSLMDRFPANEYPDLKVQAQTSFGCTPYGGAEFSGGQEKTISADCKNFQETWQSGVRGSTTVAYFLSQNFLDDYLVNGRMLKAGSAEHDVFITEMLDKIRLEARREGVQHLPIVTFACHRIPNINNSPEIDNYNSIARVKHLNAVATSWAKNRGEKVIDQYGFLCPQDKYYGKINGEDLYSDGLHFTDHSAPILWSWLAPQLQQVAAGGRD